MSKLGRSTALFVGSASLAALAANAQFAAERPTVNVGDTWIYQIAKRTDQSPGGPGNRKVVEVSDDRIFTVRRDGTTAAFDRSWNEIDPACHPDCFRPTFRFPMRVGDKWVFERKLSRNGVTQSGSYEVMALESIAVPAGNFDCLRVEGDYRAPRSHVLHTYWYCPQINNIGKQIVERRITGQYGPGRLDHDEIVLDRFIPGS